jgi:hypothetical protein
MKKQLLALTIVYITIITFTPLLYGGFRRKPSIITIKSVDSIYETAINQLEKHLAETKLTTAEKSDLITKLVGYFSPPSRFNISLKNPQSQLIYSTITKSYNEILTAQKNSQEKNSEKAKNFAERAIGKIILYKSSVNQKTKQQCKNY